MQTKWRADTHSIFETPTDAADDEDVAAEPDDSPSFFAALSGAYALVEAPLVARGWRRLGAEDRAVLSFSARIVGPGEIDFLALRPDQVVNHLARSLQLARPGPLARVVRNPPFFLRETTPGAFLPTLGLSLSLPHEWVKAKEAQGPFIARVIRAGEKSPPVIVSAEEMGQIVDAVVASLEGQEDAPQGLPWAPLGEKFAAMAKETVFQPLAPCTRAIDGRPLLHRYAVLVLSLKPLIAFTRRAFVQPSRWVQGEQIVPATTEASEMALDDASLENVDRSHLKVANYVLQCFRNTAGHSPNSVTNLFFEYILDGDAVTLTRVRNTLELADESSVSRDIGAQWAEAIALKCGSSESVFSPPPPWFAL